MKITTFALNGIILVEGDTHADARGVFMETWQMDRFEEAGIATHWCQDNLSVSTHKWTVRGLHWQLAPFAQDKLVRVVHGKILDVVVDIRRGSATFGRSLGVELSGAHNTALYVPSGFAHGFCTLEPNTIVTYKTNAFYQAKSERSMNWRSSRLDIDWPAIGDVEISAKDAAAPDFSDLMDTDFF